MIFRNARLHFKLENILPSLNTTTKKLPIFALNQVRKLCYICKSLKIKVKNFFDLNLQCFNY